MRRQRKTNGAARLREWIGRAKFESQREAADALGVHEVVLCQWLSGDRIPDLDNAHRLEDITGISTESWRLTDVSRSDAAEPVGAVNPKITKR